MLEHPLLPALLINCMASIQNSLLLQRMYVQDTPIRPHPQCYSLILGTNNYYRETDGSKVGAVKRDPDLVKREPDLVNWEPDLVKR